MIYILWHANQFTHQPEVWGVYDNETKAIKRKEEILDTNPFIRNYLHIKGFEVE